MTAPSDHGPRRRGGHGAAERRHRGGVALLRGLPADVDVPYIVVRPGHRDALRPAPPGPRRRHHDRRMYGPEGVL